MCKKLMTRNINVLLHNLYRILELWDALFTSKFRTRFSIYFFISFSKTKSSPIFALIYNGYITLGWFLYFRCFHSWNFTLSKNIRYLSVKILYYVGKKKIITASAVSGSVLINLTFSVKQILLLTAILSDKKDFNVFQKIFLLNIQEYANDPWFRFVLNLWNGRVRILNLEISTS